jgi:hypothetical protein
MMLIDFTLRRLALLQGKSWPGLSEQLRLIDKWTPAGFALSV